MAAAADEDWVLVAEVDNDSDDTSNYSSYADDGGAMGDHDDGAQSDGSSWTEVNDGDGGDDGSEEDHAASNSNNDTAACSVVPETAAPAGDVTIDNNGSGNNTLGGQHVMDDANKAFNEYWDPLIHYDDYYYGSADDHGGDGDHHEATDADEVNDGDGDQPTATANDEAFHDNSDVGSGQAATDAAADEAFHDYGYVDVYVNCNGDGYAAAYNGYDFYCASYGCYGAGYAASYSAAYGYAGVLADAFVAPTPRRRRRRRVPRARRDLSWTWIRCS